MNNNNNMKNFALIIHILNILKTTGWSPKNVSLPVSLTSPNSKYTNK